MTLNVDFSTAAILTAAVVNFIVGFIWYGPLFGKTWMKVVGITKKEAEKMHKKGMKVNMLKEFVLGLITVYILAAAIGAFEYSAFKTATVLAVLLATKDFAPTIWEGRDYTALWLHRGFNLVALNGLTYLFGIL